jgi:hypothetical protein
MMWMLPWTLALPLMAPALDASPEAKRALLQAVAGPEPALATSCSVVWPPSARPMLVRIMCSPVSASVTS